MPFKLDDLPPLIELILGGPVPLLLAFLLAAFGSRLGRGALGAALGIVVGYTVLHWKLNGALYPGRFTSLAAVRVEHWLFWIVPLGALAGLAAGHLSRGLAALLPVSLGLGALVLCFYPKLRGFWEPGEAALWALLWLTAFWLAWTGATRHGARSGPGQQWQNLLLAASAVGIASLVIGLSGSRKLAQMCGALSAAGLGVTALAVIEARQARQRDQSSAARPTPLSAVDLGSQGDLARGAQGPLLAGLLALIVIGHHYNSLDLDQALLCLAPWLLAGWLPGRSQRPLLQLVHLGVCLLPALAALGLALLRFTPPDEYDY